MLQLNVQNDLDKVDTWMRSNRLSVSYNKTAYMILTATRSQNCNFEISMNGVRIQQTDSQGCGVGSPVIRLQLRLRLLAISIIRLRVQLRLRTDSDLQLY